MRNFTDFDDKTMLSIISTLGANPYKCTVNEQLSLEETGLVWTLNVWQDISEGWDYNVKLIYSVPVMGISHLKYPKELLETLEQPLPDEYEKILDQEFFDSLYEEEMQRELREYNHARMMGWE